MNPCWFFYNYYPKYPRYKKTWLKVRFLYETDKAILVLCNDKKTWIPKSWVYKIRLQRGVFEIYTKEGSVE